MKHGLNRTHDYDDEMNTPPPPPWWQAPLVAVLFFVVMAALAIFCSSCTCTLDGESVARAIIVYQAGK